MRTVRRFCGLAAQALLVVLAVAAAGVLILPKAFGWETVTVLSGSMAPTYPADAVLAVEPIKPESVRPGDVIAFRREADVVRVTHRVVSVERTAAGLEFTTKGDANEDPDPNPVPESALRGRVVFGAPVLGRFVRAVRSPLGFGALLVVPALALIVTQAAAMWREVRAQRPSTADSRRFMT